MARNALAAGVLASRWSKACEMGQVIGSRKEGRAVWALTQLVRWAEA